MAKKTKKVSAPVPTTMADVEAIMQDVAVADAAVREITAQMDAEIALIRAKYADELDIQRSRIDSATESLESWAVLHKEECFAQKKSLELTHGVIGFRLGTPGVRLLSKVKSDQALAMMKEKLPAYVRTVEEVDKAAILADYAGHALEAAELRACGMQVTQTEKFYANPKSEERD